MKAPHWTAGNVVEIPLSRRAYCYGIVLSRPLMGFFDVRSRTSLPIDQISSQEILFRVWVMKSAIGKNGWKIIGRMPLSEDIQDDPWFFKCDPISGKLAKYRGEKEIPATKRECRKLEAAAVWSRSHIESRLASHFAGRPDKFSLVLRAFAEL